MAIAFLFKVNTTDLTGHVVQNTYSVNNLPVYKEYKDADEVTHKRFLRNKLQGTFQMAFKDLTDYASFKATLDNNRSATNFSIPCTLYDNISGTHITANCFIDYKLTVMQSTSLKEFMNVFDVAIEER